MKKTLVFALLLTVAFAPVVQADHKKEKDCKFLGKAAEASLLWNVIGSLAGTNSTNFALPPGGLSQTNSTNQLVVNLGRLLGMNHASLYTNAFALQQTNGCNLPNEVDGDAAKDLRKLSRLTGTRFDKALVSFVIEETLDAIEDAQEAALEAKSPAVRAFARQLLVALNAQLVAALEAGESVLGGDFDDLNDD